MKPLLQDQSVRVVETFNLLPNRFDLWAHHETSETSGYVGKHCVRVLQSHSIVVGGAVNGCASPAIMDVFSPTVVAG
jgi:hypothetical protein